MSKMWAIVKEEAKPGLAFRQINIPVPKNDQVLIRIKKTAICGTDVHIYDWNDWAARTIQPGMIIGHEFCGEIVAAGQQVHGFSVGERVSGEGHIVCGQCRNCLAGRRHLCRQTQGIGVNRSGAFAEYLCMPQTNIWRIPDDISDEVAACFDPLGNATHTALSFELIGEDVLITGAGPIGIMAALICQYAGARHVVLTDINDYRLELAREMGIRWTINVSRQSLSDFWSALKLKEGFDVGLEMSGSADAFRQMIDAMYHGGKIALLGIPDAQARIDWQKVVFNGLTIKGIYGREMYETWYKMTTMLQSGLDISGLITHRLPAEQFESGFQLMKNGQSGKIILDWANVSPSAG